MAFELSRTWQYVRTGASRAFPFVACREARRRCEGGLMLVTFRSLAVVVSLAIVLPLRAASDPPPPERQLYVVSTSHLDTQWRWTVKDTIEDFLPQTLRGNFELFEKYPGYVFSFEGAFRYALIKEYYPAEWERLKGYVKAGRWKVAGSWVDAGDTNVPSPESLIRQTLYGNGFFRRELGVTSRDVFLPDCFGFGFALPSVAAHCGLLGFTTQKLTWGAAMRIPFDVGLWEGVDGATLVASLNPGDYAFELKKNPTLDPEHYAAVDRQAAISGLPIAMKFVGTGDVGVPPLEPSVALLQQSLSGPGPLKVRSVASDQLARDLAHGPEAARLPRYRGELLLTSHGVGCYTSQAAMKRFNRTNQRLFDAAERASVAASWLGGLDYPRELFRDSWMRFLWHQFHDDLTGTSIPEAYAYSWNDEVIVGNQLTDAMTTAVGSVSGALDTRVEPGGVPLVVYNPLAIEREDVVEADVKFEGRAPAAVRVTGPDGREVPAQVVSVEGAARVVFVASVPPASFSVFRVSTAAAARSAGELKVSPAGLENARYRVTLDASGNPASVFDKKLGRELLSAPLTLQLFEDEPRKWSAWEIEYSALSAPPREVVGGPATVRVVEGGPARVALEVTRRAGGSTFVQRIRLASGKAGDRVELLTDVDWRTTGTLLKAAFPVAAANRLATYDLGLGVVERETNRPNVYEVPAQQWADVTDTGGTFGVAVMNDSRHGWDRPDEKTLRLSLIHTPRVVKSWDWLADQASNDLGDHRTLMALAGHAGDWRDGVALTAERLNQPLYAFQTSAHPGPLGRTFSLLRVERGGKGVPPVSVRAVKALEEGGDEVVVRLQELSGRPLSGVRVAFARPIVSVRELNGAEEPLEDGGPRPGLAVKGGALELDFVPFRPRTVAVKLDAAPARAGRPTATPLTLPFDLDGISRDDARADGDFDGAGNSLAGELVAETIVSGGVPFRTGPQGRGEKNVLVCRGQKISLPEGQDHVDLLAAAVGGDRTAAFTAGGARTSSTVPDWSEPVGQWNSRLVAGELQQEPGRIAPGYAKSTPVAWVGTHRHGPRGESQAYVLSTLFRIRVRVPPGARELTLPDDEHLRVLAATAAKDAEVAVKGGSETVAAQPFGDPMRSTVVHQSAPRQLFLDTLAVTLTTPTPGATIRFTLDGTEPSVTSPAYREPLVLRDTATVKARAFAPGLDHRFVATGRYVKRRPAPAADVAEGSLSPGLSCRLYEGTWSKLPDFGKLTAKRSLVLPTVGLPAEPRDNFGLVCEGYLSAPADAVYTLSVRSADGSELYVDGERVLRNESIDLVSRRADVALSKGPHRLELRYFQAGFTSGLELKMDSPDQPLLAVTADRLSHLAVGP